MIKQGPYILSAAGAFIFNISFLVYSGAIKETDNENNAPAAMRM
jgi:hypothetical protein